METNIPKEVNIGKQCENDLQSFTELQRHILKYHNYYDTTLPIESDFCND